MSRTPPRLYSSFSSSASIDIRSLVGSRSRLARRFSEAAQVVQAVDALRHRLEVGQQAAEPALVDVRHPAAVGPLLDRVARLLLGPDEEDRAALAGDLGGEVARLGEQLLGLQQVDDVDAVVLAVDVAAHARIPAPRLVAEMQPCRQQVSESGLGHRCSLGSKLLPSRFRGPGYVVRAGQGPLFVPGGRLLDAGECRGRAPPGYWRLRSPPATRIEPRMNGCMRQK